MNSRGPRTRPISRAEISVRAASARRYLEVGEVVIGADPADRQVAAGLAVLAAVAAGDAICGSALGEHARGQDHGQSADLVRTVRPDGADLARHLARVLEHKPNAHYGTTYLTPETVQAMLHHARELVDAMDRRLR